MQGSTRRRQNLDTTDGIKVVKTFDSAVFSGASIETDTYNLDSLLSLPEIVRVWPNQVIQLEPLDPEAVAVEDAPNYTTHNATGVSKLHDEGIFGEGVKVGIVDTGVWYYHPAVSISQTQCLLGVTKQHDSLVVDSVPDSKLQVAMILWAMGVGNYFHY